MQESGSNCNSLTLYSVTIRTAIDRDVVANKTTSDTEIEFGNLHPHTDYLIDVRTTNDAGLISGISTIPWTTSTSSKYGFYK